MKTIPILLFLLASAGQTLVRQVTGEELSKPYKPDVVMDGKLMHAYQSALKQHRKIMSLEKNVAEDDFTIQLQEDRDFIRVHFIPKTDDGLTKHSLGSAGARSEVLYAVDKSTFKVLLSVAMG